MKSNNCNNTTSLPDLLNSMADVNYSDLQVFLSRTKMNNCFFKKEFLYVDQYSFRKISLNDIRYCDDNIYLDINDYNHSVSKTLCIDINDKPAFTMVLWQDIADMVRGDNTSTSCSDGLLEFDF